MKYIIRSIEAFLLAFLLVAIFAFFFREDQAGGFSGLVFLAGLVAFAVMLFRSPPHKVHFRFFLIFGIEWLLLPAIAYINAAFRSNTLGEVMGNIIFFAILASVGIIAGLIFLSLAILFYAHGRKRSPHPE
ncbi:MAG: hypothetical protein U9N44_02630 [Chloroflexota bacterium]|nr:hypothetical protein [Chloroflexota bacterium]